MKALVNTDVETLTYMDQADPIAKAGEELVRIQYSGICGSDMHAFLGHDTRRPTPIILGHEASGTIVGGPRDGTLVTISHHNPAEWLRDLPCLPIGQAKYMFGAPNHFHAATSGRLC